MRPSPRLRGDIGGYRYREVIDKGGRRIEGLNHFYQTGVILQYITKLYNIIDKLLENHTEIYDRHISAYSRFGKSVYICVGGICNPDSMSP